MTVCCWLLLLLLCVTSFFFFFFFSFASLSLSLFLSLFLPTNQPSTPLYSFYEDLHITVWWSGLEKKTI